LVFVNDHQYQLTATALDNAATQPNEHHLVYDIQHATFGGDGLPANGGT